MWCFDTPPDGTINIIAVSCSSVSLDFLGEHSLCNEREQNTLSNDSSMCKLSYRASRICRASLWVRHQGQGGRGPPTTLLHRWSRQRWWTRCFWWWWPWRRGWSYLRCREPRRRIRSQGWWLSVSLQRQTSGLLTPRIRKQSDSMCGRHPPSHLGCQTSSTQCRRPHTPPSSRVERVSSWPGWFYHKHWGRLLPRTASPPEGWWYPGSEEGREVNIIFTPS